LQHHKEQDGRVYVYLDRGETVEDKVRDSSRDELVDELRDRVRRLEQDLDTRDRELSEMRRLLAGALERIPELEAARDSPPEPRDARETASEGEAGTSAPPDRETGVHGRSWWRRFFGVE
jgi:hypothetical protein